jgi:hypothetical protein
MARLNVLHRPPNRKKTNANARAGKNLSRLGRRPALKSDFPNGAEG